MSAEVEYHHEALADDSTGNRPVWVGVAIRYDDGTVHAYQIDEPTYGEIATANTYDDPPGLLMPRTRLDTEIEITVRGRSLFHWQQGADQAAGLREVEAPKAIEP